MKDKCMYEKDLKKNRSTLKDQGMVQFLPVRLVNHLVRKTAVAESLKRIGGGQSCHLMMERFMKCLGLQGNKSFLLRSLLFYVLPFTCSPPILYRPFIIHTYHISLLTGRD